MSNFFDPSPDNSSITKRRLVSLLKWALYFLIMLITFSLMQTPGLFSVFSIRPVIIFPMVIVIAMFEKEMSGGLFGILTGLIWGSSTTILFGFHGIILFVCCVVCGVVTRYYLKSTLLTGFILVFLSSLFYFATDFYFRYYIWNYSGLLSLLKNYYLPTLIYTTITTPIFFYLIKLIHEKVRIELNPNEPMEVQ